MGFDALIASMSSPSCRQAYALSPSRNRHLDKSSSRCLAVCPQASPSAVPPRLAQAAAHPRTDPRSHAARRPGSYPKPWASTHDSASPRSHGSRKRARTAARTSRSRSSVSTQVALSPQVARRVSSTRSISPRQSAASPQGAVPLARRVAHSPRKCSSWDVQPGTAVTRHHATTPWRAATRPRSISVPRLLFPFGGDGPPRSKPLWAISRGGVARQPNVATRPGLLRRCFPSSGSLLRSRPCSA